MSVLPCGTVTFLFTDVEGSTRLLRELGEGYARVLAEHRSLLRDVFARFGGVEVDTQGDAFFVAFARASDAVAAAHAAQEALAGRPVRVRMGLHTGEPSVTAEGYVGIDVHKAARVAAAGHGGQVLLSRRTRELVEVDDLLDLGEHRLKDFAEPVWIYQLGSDRFPPLKTISNTNLPRPPSSFVGRGHEVAELRSLVRGGARLVTLTGPGGSGKTRLAIEAAAELVPDFRNGVFWVGLATLRDPALMAETFAQTLGAKDGPAEHIGDRELLLLVDNFEHVVEAAPELSALLSTCANLRLLVTSRERLRLAGEVEYQVPPLAHAEAVELFCARARLEPDETVAGLCRRLDYLPLAVELAAARTSVLLPAQILDRLSQRLDLLRGGRDAEARQQTLRATIEWSYDLLTPQEQRLFGRLAVFSGGCTVETAELVAGADLDTLQSLVDKSLVRHSNERFWMLETMREYALERLAASGEEERVHEFHAAYFGDLAERAYQERQERPEWLARLQTEQDNLRAALDWLARRTSERELQLAGALGWFWDSQARLLEGRQRLEGALARSTDPSPSRARALTALARIAGWSDKELARQQCEESLRIWRQLGDVEGEAEAREALGWAWWTEDIHRARRSFEQSLELRQQLRAPALVRRTLLGLCNLLIAERNVKSAEPRALELLHIAQEANDQPASHMALHLLGDCALLRHDCPAAEDRYRRSLAIAVTLENPSRAAVEIVGLAMALAGQARPLEALQLWAAVQEHWQEQGATTTSPPYWEDLKQHYFGRAQREAGRQGAPASERGRRMQLDHAIKYAITLPPTTKKQPATGPLPTQ